MCPFLVTGFMLRGIGVRSGKISELCNELDIRHHNCFDMLLELCMIAKERVYLRVLTLRGRDNENQQNFMKTWMKKTK